MGVLSIIVLSCIYVRIHEKRKNEGGRQFDESTHHVIPVRVADLKKMKGIDLNEKNK